MIKKIVTSLFGAIFLIATVVVVFSAYQILSSDKKINESLKQWEEKPIAFATDEPLKTPSKSGNPTIEPNKFPYSSRPETGDVFGKIVIPSIGLTAPIIEGTTEDELSKGVGHYIGSVLPGEWDNSVLAAHRDSVFKDLDQVKIGDKVIIETTVGTFTYKITEQKIVDEDDRTIIVPYDDPVLTLVTCYPFDFVGPAPERYILFGELIEN